MAIYNRMSLNNITTVQCVPIFSDTGDHDAHVEKSYSYATDWFDSHIDSSNFASTLGTNNLIN